MSRRLLPVLVTVCQSIVLAPGVVWAQGQLVPIATSDTPLPVPDTFGQQSTIVGNQAGDVAVLDSAGSAVHLKTNGSPTWTRVVQAGDEVPGLPGSRIHAIVALRMNASGLLAMAVELNLSSGEQQRAIVVFNGASLVNVVDGSDTAPNSGGARFGQGLALAALNDTGSIVVTSPLVPDPTDPAGQVFSIFIVPSGEAPVRVAGRGDPAPGTASTFQSPSVAGFNSNGELLIESQLAVGGHGLFIGTTTSLRKVVAAGDPHPAGGTFFNVGGGRLNGLGRVMFLGSSVSAGVGVCIAEPNSTITQVVSTGTAAPVPMGGTLFNPMGFAFNDAGTVLFDASVQSNPSTTRGVFRLTPGGVVEAVLYRNQPAPGTATTIGDFSVPVMNAAGQAAFLAKRADGTPLAFYFQAGTSQPVLLVLHGGPSTVPGGGTADLSKSVLGPVLDDGRSLIHLSVAGGTVDVAYFLRSPGGVTSMVLTTSDELPDGGRMLLAQRGLGVRGSGSFVGFTGLRPGGGVAAFVHHLSTQVTTRVAGDGDLVQGTSDRFRITTSTPAFVNSSGQMALAGLFYGPSGIRPGIVLAGAGGGLQKIVVDGDMDDVGFVLRQHPLHPLAPSGINSSGQVAFNAYANGLLPGIWVGVAGVPATKAVRVNDQTTVGHNVLSLIGLPAMNDAGQVLFRASTNWESGLFLATAGGPIQKVVADGEPAPGGGTFISFIAGSLNNAGQVAFVANTTGAGGGVFVGSTSGAPVAVALNGADAPSGGTFAITGPGWDTIINDQGDVLFRADLAGTAADSGHFIRRGPAGSVESLVLEGDPAPGTPFVFSSFKFQSATGESQQLSAGGGVTFRGDYFDGSGRVTNYWHIGTNGVVEPVAVSLPEGLGGGTGVRTSPFSSWAGARYPMWVRLTGGSFVEGVFLFVPETAIPVGTGSDVQVRPVDSVSGQAPVTATFETVTGAGVMTLTVSASGPALPVGYALGMPPRFYDLTTTATHTGSISVCINFNDVMFPPGSTIRLLHYSASTWSDVTTTVADRVACGSVTSLSPFAVARLTTPGPNLVQNGDFSGGLASWVTFATPDDSYIQAAVNGGVLEYYRVPPPPGQTNQAVIFQRTGVALETGVPLVAAFDFGNSSPVRKRISVLIQDFDFSDLFVCTFWLPPNLPLTTYEIRTHTTKAWANATIAFYAATAGSGGGAYQIDNVSLRTFAEGVTDRTECVDPTRPVPPGGPDGPTLLVNGDFEADLPPWGVFGQIAYQFLSGMFEFHRTPGTPAGVVLQKTQQTAPAGEVFTATFELGSRFSVRRRVTVLLHDDDFSDLAACTFWLPPSPALQPYEIRMFTTKAWTNATLSVYPVTVDTSSFVRLDNVSLRRTPAVTFNGTDCLEPAASEPAPPAARGKLTARR